MEWFLRLIRITGASFPGASSLVQLQSELSSIEFENRLRVLEDPIGNIDEHVQDASKVMYQAMKDQDSVNLNLDNDFYEKYSRTLILLENGGLLKREVASGHPQPLCINLTNPFFIIYMSAFYEDADAMSEINDLVNNCPKGKTLNAELISQEKSVPKYTVRAVFLIYESKRFGCCTGGMQKLRYQGMRETIEETIETATL